MRYVIIGSGPAGIHCIEAIREIDKVNEIILISRESTPPYTPIALSEYALGNISEESLYFRSREFYEAYGVKPIIGVKAEKVDPASQTIRLSNGKDVRYDKLLIATGADAVIPKIEGIELDGVCTLRSISDANQIRKRIRDARRIAVIGAGPLGVEIAVALRRIGKEVTIIEALDRILPKVLDPPAERIVRNYLCSLGISIMTKSTVSKICGKSKVKAVVVDGERVECDLVIMAVGIKPNIELVKDTDVSINRGILVNEKMQTSVENIYASGDVAESIGIFHERIIAANWVEAVLQGRVAGYNMAGKEMRHTASVLMSILKIPIPVLSIGYPASLLKGKRYNEIEYALGSVYRKAIFVNNRLVGFQSIGSYHDIKLAGICQHLIRKGAIVPEKSEILGGRILFTLSYKTHLRWKKVR